MTHKIVIFFVAESLLPYKNHTFCFLLISNSKDMS